MRDFKFNNKFAYITMFVAVMLLFSIALLSSTSEISYANQEAEIIFPNDGYIQSKSPSMIAVNEKYLIIYDDELSSLFSRNLIDNVDLKYNLSNTTVNSIHLLDSYAFIVSSDKYYSIDLTNENSQLEEIALDQTLTFNSIKSDGNHLFAKTISGKLYVYDNTLTKIDEVESNYEYLFAGNNVFFGKDNIVYSLSFNLGTPTINIYSFDIDTSVEYSISEIVQNAYIGKQIFTQVNNTITILSKDNGQTLLTTEIQASSYTCFDNTLYVISNDAINVYEYNEESNTIAMINSISMAGSDNKHLNTPTSIVKTSDSLIISDYSNKRIAYINSENLMNVVQLETNPRVICENNGSIYALCENNTIYKIQDMQIAQSYSINDCVSITYLDKLYALKADGIYTLIGGKFIKFTSINDAKIITSNKEGNNLYAVSKNSLYVISKTGKIINQINFDFTDIIDLKVDYAGNLYLLKNNEIVKISNDLNVLSISSTYSPTLNVTATYTSILLDGEFIYLTCSECLVIKDGYQSITKSTFKGTEIDLSRESFKYAKLNNSNSISFDANANSDSIKLNTEDIILISSKEYNDSYSYAKTSQENIIIKNQDYELINEDNNTNKYIVTKSQYIYSSILENQVGAMNVGEIVQAISQITINETTFVKFENDGFKYIELSSLEIIQNPSSEENNTNKNVARVQTKKIGTQINIYELASIDSDIILSLSDGKKIEIIGEDEEFYYILYNNQFGYILKSDVKLDGLTQIQIIAIILSIIVFVAGTIIFVSISIYKKKND